MPRPDELCYKIADVTFRVTTPHGAMRLSLDEVTARFVCADDRPDTTIRVKWRDLSNGVVGGKKVFDPGVAWKLYEQRNRFVFAFYSSASGPIPYKVLRMKRDFSAGTLLLHPSFFETDAPLYPLAYPIDEVIFTSYLAQGKGAHVHACGMIDAAGKGHLFIGQSGAGKSTIASLLKALPGCTMLSDDRIAVRLKNGRPWVFGTPWHGDAGLASPESAPLSTIFFLAKGAINEIVPLPEATIVGRLLCCSFPAFFDREGLEFTFSFFEHLARSIPAYELRFRPDEEIADFIEQLTGGRG